MALFYNLATRFSSVHNMFVNALVTLYFFDYYNKLLIFEYLEINLERASVSSTYIRHGNNFGESS